MINIPMWARPPKSRNGVKATERGWIDLKTGELLRRVPNLLARLDEVKRQLAKEYVTQVEMLDQNFSDDFDVSELEKELDQEVQKYEAPTSKELAENAEGTNPEDVKKEIRDEFMNEITKKEQVSPVVTTNIEQTVANNTSVAEDKKETEVKKKRKYTKRDVNTEEQKPKRKYTRRKKKDEFDAG